MVAFSAIFGALLFTSVCLNQWLNASHVYCTGTLPYYTHDTTLLPHATIHAYCGLASDLPAQVNRMWSHSVLQFTLRSWIRACCNMIICRVKEDKKWIRLCVLALYCSVYGKNVMTTHHSDQVIPAPTQTIWEQTCEVKANGQSPRGPPPRPPSNTHTQISY